MPAGPIASSGAGVTARVAGPWSVSLAASGQRILTSTPIHLAFAELGRIYGARAGRALRRDIRAEWDWGRDPHALGAYAALRPGRGGAREALSAPLAGGRLMLAGEAEVVAALLRDALVGQPS